MRHLNVLIGCEASGIVRDAFIRHGHNAISCDLRPTQRPGPHYQGDVRDLLWPGLWDLAIFHPDCTYLTCSAEWCYKDDPGRPMRPGVLFGAARRAARVEALDFVRLLLDAPIPFIALENPVGKISTEIEPALQYVQPYDYGDDASKNTGFWQRGGLPPLQPTKRCPGRWVDHNGKRVERWSNQTDSGQNRLGPSADRWAERSETYPGIADAMADQWGHYVASVLANINILVEMQTGVRTI